MWIFYSFLGALGQAVDSAATKKALGNANGSKCVFAAISFLAVGIIFGIIVWLKTGTFLPTIGNHLTFVVSMAGVVAVNLVAVLCAYRALELSEFSYLMPFISLTSLLMIIPPMFPPLREFPSLMSLPGIALIFVGAFLMNYQKKGIPVSEQRKKNRQGLLYFSITALCYTLAPTLAKLAIQETSPLDFSFLSHFFIGIAFSLIVLVLYSTGKIKKVPLRKIGVPLIIAIAATAIGNNSINFALSEAPVAYVFAIKRTMPIFAFIIAIIFFKERNHLRQRLIATILMVAGVILTLIGK